MERKRRRLGPRRRRAVLVVFGLVVAAVLVELLSVGWFFLTEGGLFYLADAPAETEKRKANPFDRAASLHPFWATSRRPGSPVMHTKLDERLDLMILGEDKRPPWTTLRTNNLGFVSAHDYPVPRENAADLMIGVFGGSVAKFVALLGGETIEARLRADPALTGRNPRIVNLAKAGAKQPQQAMILQYSLFIGQPLDVVVNVDGFNEAALSVLNHERGVDISFPRDYPRGFSNFVQRPTQESVEWQARVLSAHEKVESLRGGLRQRVSAGLWSLSRARYALAEKGAAALAESRPPASEEGSSLFASVDLDPGASRDQIAETIADQWMRASLSMHATCTGRGIAYVHVLQPNQYYSQREFDDEERSIAISPGHPYEAGVQLVYPRLEARVPLLAAEGIEAVSGVGLLDDEPRRVYADNAAHFTDVGNEILGEVVAAAILRALRVVRRRGSTDD